MQLPLRALGALVALNLPAVAQSFEPGDLYLYTPAFQGGSSSAGAIVRVDPGGGSPELEAPSGSDIYLACARRKMRHPRAAGATARPEPTR